MKSKKTNDIFLVLGAVWIIVGLFVYPNDSIWPMGFIFLIVWLIGKFKQNKNGKL